MRYGPQVVATALVANEGGFDREIATAVYAGQRRLQGHLIPQSLAAHVGLEMGAELRGSRIMRIAVHTAVQGRGLGTRLLDTITQRASMEGGDWIGSSFGATAELLRFWERSGLLPVRVGLKREASSGTHSVMVLRPLTAAAKTLIATARKRLSSHLPHLLADPLHDLAPNLTVALLQRTRMEARDIASSVDGLNEWDWRELAAFAFAKRGFEMTLAPIWKLACVALTDPDGVALLSPTEQALLIARVLQQRHWQDRHWQDALKALGINGKAQTITALRRALRPLVLHYGGEMAQREANRLACR